MASKCIHAPLHGLVDPFMSGHCSDLLHVVHALLSLHAVVSGPWKLDVRVFVHACLQADPSPHLTSPHLTSPHLTSPHLTSPHLTSPHPLLLAVGPLLLPCGLR